MLERAEMSEVGMMLSGAVRLKVVS